MAKKGRTSKTYKSAARTSVPPPTARSGRRLTFLGRLFMRASVLLVSTFPLSPLGENVDDFDRALAGYLARGASCSGFGKNRRRDSRSPVTLISVRTRSPKRLVSRKNRHSQRPGKSHSVHHAHLSLRLKGIRIMMRA